MGFVEVAAVCLRMAGYVVQQAGCVVSLVSHIVKCGYAGLTVTSWHYSLVSGSPIYIYIYIYICVCVCVCKVHNNSNNNIIIT